MIFDEIPNLNLEASLEAELQKGFPILFGISSFFELNDPEIEKHFK